MTVIDFAVRKAAGDTHQNRVQTELEKRGWTVDKWGQDILSDEVSRALRRTDSTMRWEPDFVTACGSTIRFVDAKGSLRGGGNTDRNFVSSRSIAAHLRLSAERDIPVYYVFGDLGVLTPAEVMRYAGAERISAAGGYISVPRTVAHKFDEVFGALHVPTWGAMPNLFEAA